MRLLTGKEQGGPTNVALTGPLTQSIKRGELGSAGRATPTRGKSPTPTFERKVLSFLSAQSGPYKMTGEEPTLPRGNEAVPSQGPE